MIQVISASDALREMQEEEEEGLIEEEAEELASLITNKTVTLGMHFKMAKNSNKFMPIFLI